MSFSPGRGQSTIYQSFDGWEDAVVNAAGADRKVRATITGIADRIAISAKAGISSTVTTGGDAQRLVQGSKGVPGVASMIDVRNVQVWIRNEFHKGTRIPVALVVSDHWASQWLEVGHGARIAATHFMRAAAHAAGRGRFFARELGH